MNIIEMIMFYDTSIIKLVSSKTHLTEIMKMQQIHVCTLEREKQKQ